jgi:hypothetical protein
MGHKNKIFNNKCEHIGKAVEFLSKSTQFEKCYTFFDINQMNESSVVYKMDKRSHIEIGFQSEKFKNNCNLKNTRIIDLIYVSLHSSQSPFKSVIFQPINISSEPEAHIVYNFEFSKIIVKNLQWPHETNCIRNQFEYKSENRKYYSFENCVNSCIFDRIYAKNKCIQTKYGFETDLILENTKKRDFEICAENMTQKVDSHKIEMFCLRNCRQNCINEYIQVDYYETIEFSNKTITIKSSNFPLFGYELISKFSLHNYASNIGGIISLWFGLAVVDLHKLIKQLMIVFRKFFRKIGTILTSIKIIRNLFNHRFIFLLVKINNFISILFIKAENFNWKLIFKMLCLLCFGSDLSVRLPWNKN